MPAHHRQTPLIADPSAPAARRGNGALVDRPSRYVIQYHDLTEGGCRAGLHRSRREGLLHKE
jgi:hypothetical protein